MEQILGIVSPPTEADIDRLKMKILWLFDQRKVYPMIMGAPSFADAYIPLRSLDRICYPSSYHGSYRCIALYAKALN